MEQEELTGRIHSVESFGTVDGPGIRLVIFFQGCPLRCLYCHNPDTWKFGEGTLMTTEEILGQYEQNQAFYQGGGITATGGEPMMQLDFLTELFFRAKEKNIHTCLDTSGIVFRPGNLDKIEKLIQYTDLVLLDVKHVDTVRHKELTGQSNQRVFDFLRFLDQHNVPVWVRHVLVPGFTDDQEGLQRLGEALGPFRCIQVVDVLPYHTMGREKYQELHMEYPLKDTPEATQAQALIARQQILMGIGKYRKKEAL